MSVGRIGRLSVGLAVDELIKDLVQVVEREIHVVRGSIVVGSDDPTSLVALRLEVEGEATRGVESGPMGKETETGSRRNVLPFASTARPPSGCP